MIQKTSPDIRKTFRIAIKMCSVRYAEEGGLLYSLRWQIRFYRNFYWVQILGILETSLD